MVRTSITEQAFLAIASTLALGSVGFENPVNENGERLIWLERTAVDRLRCHSSAGGGGRLMGKAAENERIKLSATRGERIPNTLGWTKRNVFDPAFAPTN
jgi:hypothetical protein